MLTIEEFTYFVKRRNIGMLISKGEFEQAEQEIKELEIESNLYQQDMYLLYVILYLSKKQETKAELYVEKALKETLVEVHSLKDISPSVIMQKYFSETEIDLLLLYIYIKELLGIEEISFLECMISYISFHITDEKLKNKKLAMALYLKALLYKKHSLWQECCDCCEEVIEAEIKNGTLAVLFQALKMEVECFQYNVIVKKKIGGGRTP